MKKSGEQSNTIKRLLHIWKYARPFVAFVLSLLLVSGAVFYAVQFVLKRFVYPVNSENARPVEVVIPQGSSAGRIAEILYSANGDDGRGLIPSTASFKVYVDFVGKANSLKAGTYFLSQNMDMAEIVKQLCEGNSVRKVVTLIVQEGWTVERLAQALMELDLIEDTTQFLLRCGDQSAYGKYSFITQLSTNEERKYILEGYLFPDSYLFYADSDTDEIIDKLLSRFNELYTEAYKLRAEELGLTMDQVITLASIIEREAVVADDFAKVSAVFHNRLKAEMRLESCATLCYVTGTNKLVFSAEELELVSPYNTYRNAGLPIGPICNPGIRAIEAALYPNEGYLEAGYMYFCSKNPNETKELAFAVNYEDHQTNVERYSEYWD